MEVIIMRKYIGIGLVLLLSLVLMACGEEPPDEKDGFFSYSWSSSLGSVEGLPNLQRLSYEVMLTNEHAIPMYVTEVVIKPSDTAGSILEGEIEPIPVDRRIQPGDDFTVAGSFVLRTKALSKEEILALAPFVMGIEVRTSETIFFE
jgi:hypothetical protein